MPSYDDRTPSGWPLPFKSNTLEFDVERLRETFLTLDDILTHLKANLTFLSEKRIAGVEEKQYILDDRMDVIAGQATEDTEILDARVDAERVTHPNLGHNLRNLHSEILRLDETLKTSIQDFHGLLRQFNELAHAQIQTELTVQEVSDSRRQDIQQEAQTRIDADAEILGEVAHEISVRSEQGEFLQSGTDELSEAYLQQILNLVQEAEARRKNIHDVVERIDEQAQNLRTETRQRQEEIRRVDGRIDAETAKRASDVSTLHEELAGEENSRRSDDESLQLQANANAKAITRTALALQSLNTQRKADLAHETQERLSADDALKHSTDTLSEASIQQSFNLEREAQHRRKDIQQTHELIEAEAQQSRISLQSESSARQAADVLEAQTRTDMDTILQVQINDLVAAVIKVAINDYQARERFRESIDDFYQVMADSGNMTYMGARVASSNEIGDMLSDVFSGSDDGEVYASEIPEELRDRVASSSEVSEILAEIFNPKN